jgi:hypothetical protein
MDGDDGVGAVVLAAQHLARFRAFDFLLQLIERTRQVSGDVFARARPLDKDADVVGAPLERLQQRTVFIKAAAPLHYFLSLFLIAPEVRRRGPRLYLRELFVEVGALKDASAARATVYSGLRTGV